MVKNNKGSSGSNSKSKLSSEEDLALALASSKSSKKLVAKKSDLSADGLVNTEAKNEETKREVPVEVKVSPQRLNNIRTHFTEGETPKAEPSPLVSESVTTSLSVSPKGSEIDSSRPIRSLKVPLAVATPGTTATAMTSSETPVSAINWSDKLRRDNERLEAELGDKNRELLALQSHVTDIETHIKVSYSELLPESTGHTSVLLQLIAVLTTQRAALKSQNEELSTANETIEGLHSGLKSAQGQFATLERENRRIRNQLLELSENSTESTDESGRRISELNDELARLHAYIESLESDREAERHRHQATLVSSLEDLELFRTELRRVMDELGRSNAQLLVQERQLSEVRGETDRQVKAASDGERAAAETELRGLRQLLQAAQEAARVSEERALAAEGRNGELEAQNGKLMHFVTGLQSAVDRAAIELKTTKDQLRAANDRIAQLELAVSSSDQSGRIQELLDYLSKAHRENHDLNERVIELEALLRQVQDEAGAASADVNKDLDAAEAEVAKLTAALEKANRDKHAYHSRVEELQAMLNDSQGNVQGLEGEISALSRERQQLLVRVSELEAAHLLCTTSGCRTTIRSLEDKLAERCRQLLVHEGDTKDLRGGLEAAQSRLAEAEAALREAQRISGEQQRHVDRLNATVNRLQAENAELLGRSSAVTYSPPVKQGSASALLANADQSAKIAELTQSLKRANSSLAQHVTEEARIVQNSERLVKVLESSLEAKTAECEALKLELIAQTAANSQSMVPIHAPVPSKQFGSSVSLVDPNSSAFFKAPGESANAAAASATAIPAPTGLQRFSFTKEGARAHLSQHNVKTFMWEDLTSLIRKVERLQHTFFVSNEPASAAPESAREGSRPPSRNATTPNKLRRPPSASDTAAAHRSTTPTNLRTTTPSKLRRPEESAAPATRTTTPGRVSRTTTPNKTNRTGAGESTPQRMERRYSFANNTPKAIVKPDFDLDGRRPSMDGLRRAPLVGGSNSSSSGLHCKSGDSGDGTHTSSLGLRRPSLTAEGERSTSRGRFVVPGVKADDPFGTQKGSFRDVRSMHQTLEQRMEALAMQPAYVVRSVPLGSYASSAEASPVRAPSSGVGSHGSPAQSADQRRTSLTAEALARRWAVHGVDHSDPFGNDHKTDRDVRTLHQSIEKRLDAVASQPVRTSRDASPAVSRPGVYVHHSDRTDPFGHEHANNRDVRSVHQSIERRLDAVVAQPTLHASEHVSKPGIYVHSSHGDPFGADHTGERDVRAVHQSIERRLNAVAQQPVPHATEHVSKPGIYVHSSHGDPFNNDHTGDRDVRAVHQSIERRLDAVASQPVPHATEHVSKPGVYVHSSHGDPFGSDHTGDRDVRAVHKSIERRLEAVAQQPVPHATEHVSKPGIYVHSSHGDPFNSDHTGDRDVREVHQAIEKRIDALAAQPVPHATEHVSKPGIYVHSSHGDPFNSDHTGDRDVRAVHQAIEKRLDAVAAQPAYHHPADPLSPVKSPGIYLRSTHGDPFGNDHAGDRDTRKVHESIEKRIDAIAHQPAHHATEHQSRPGIYVHSSHGDPFGNDHAGDRDVRQVHQSIERRLDAVAEQQPPPVHPSGAPSDAQLAAARRRSLSANQEYHGPLEESFSLPVGVMQGSLIDHTQEGGKQRPSRLDSWFASPSGRHDSMGSMY